ncbi:F420-dependent oxidoreductase-like protein [Sinobacterium caligoides]|uniref:F420-dependent oxidoreductase-like protein n=1 Tax=Sinobacterium caligoides TaxID=933926 RepID=A0A3N2DXX3_9GAMM|nr:LLM class F420-dependent oxidoreductase [Sinobacterium caligoides]ROS04683.1 F420-dependent oxidoreductase-like protein [Sinobacterium caligoides]
MRLGLVLGYSGKQINLPMDLIHHAEELGFDSVWTAESYSSDAVSTAAWVLANTTKIRVGTAIMQMVARTPATAATTAMSLAQLSGGRFIMGLGASGPQVVEGWHGTGYKRPLTRTREYIDICRQIMAREAPCQYEGKIYQLPYNGPGSVGLGKPLKTILQADTSIPIYTASITPSGLATSAEIADGVFPVWMDPNNYDVVGKHLEKGFAKAGNGKGLADFEVAPVITTIMGDDLKACEGPARAMMALYIGGMGAKNNNFYTDYATAMGYGADAEKIQDLYLAGKKDEAALAIPQDLLDAVALLGPEARIREQLQAWKAAGSRGDVSAMLLGAVQPEVLSVVADEML